jgi:hypothetical protein
LEKRVFKKFGEKKFRVTEIAFLLSINSRERVGVFHAAKQE